MIVVKIELHPGGEPEHKRLLGCIVAANDGTGTTEAGNYCVGITHTGKRLHSSSACWKSAIVKGFNRRKSVYSLLRQILNEMDL